MTLLLHNINKINVIKNDTTYYNQDVEWFCCDITAFIYFHSLWGGNYGTYSDWKYGDLVRKGLNDAMFHIKWPKLYHVRYTCNVRVPLFTPHCYCNSNNYSGVINAQLFVHTSDEIVHTSDEIVPLAAWCFWLSNWCVKNIFVFTPNIYTPVSLICPPLICRCCVCVCEFYFAIIKCTCIWFIPSNYSGVHLLSFAAICGFLLAYFSCLLDLTESPKHKLDRPTQIPGREIAGYLESDWSREVTGPAIPSWYN